MVGSPNYVFMVYDGDDSRASRPRSIRARTVRSRSRTCSNRSTRTKTEPYDDAQFSGRSDYEEFIFNDIPAGGLFTGAEVVKTAAQQALWGGTAGDSSTPATTSRATRMLNNNTHALDVNSDAIAFAVLTVRATRRSP